MIITHQPTTHIQHNPHILMIEQVVEGYADQIKELSRAAMNKEAEVSACHSDG